MSVSSLHLAGLGLGLAIAVLPRVAAAESKIYAVDYRVIPQCPDLEHFVAEVSKRSVNAIYAPLDPSAQRFVVGVENRDGKTTGQVIANPSEAPRLVTGLSCSTVIEGLALIVAVSLDPYLFESAPTGPIAPGPIAPGPLAPGPLAPGPKPAQKAALEPVVPESELRKEAAPQRSAGLSAGARFIGGAAPRPLVGVGIATALSLWGQPWLLMSWEYAQTNSFDVASGAARFRLTTVGAHGCVDGLRGSEGGLSLCAGADGGLLYAEGIAAGQVAVAHSVTRPWFDFALLGRAGWNLAKPVRLEADGGVGYAATHRAFVFENPRETVHDPSGWVWRLGIGVGASLW